MKIISILLTVVVLTVSSLVCAFAESEGIFSDLGIEVAGDASVYSQYVWRGVLLDRDAVFQPGFYISSPATKIGKFKVGVWSSQDLENKDDLLSDEYDYILDYTYDFKDVSFSFGHTYYDFPDAIPADGAPRGFSREFYTGLAFPNVPLSPSVFFYRDYGNPEDGGGEGSYTLISAAHSIPIKNTSVSFDLGGHVGFNHELFINGNGGDVGLKAGVTMPLTKSLSFSPNINYSIPFGDVLDSEDGNQKNRFFAGGTFAYAF